MRARIAVAVVFLVLAVCGQAAPVNILYLGDSLSDFDRGSNHVDRLQGLLDTHQPGAGRIFNYAVRGDYIERLVKRLEGRKGTYELLRYADIWSRTYDLALVFLGHNDTRAYNDTDFAEPFMADEKVRAGYHRLIDILRGQGVGRIILVSPASPNFELCCSNAVKSLQRIADGKADKKRVARFGDPKLLDGFIKVVRAVAAERGLEYLDFHDRMAALPDKASYVRPTDGVHLTQKGHVWISAREFEYLTNGLKSVTAGWDNLNPDRCMPKPDKVYWSAPYETGANGFDVSWRKGATGSVEFAADCIRVRKTNDRGLVVITPIESFEVSEGTELQAFVGVRTLNATDPDLARGYPRLWGGKENLAYFRDLDGPVSVESPLQEGLFSLASGMFVRKLCHFRADASGRATPAIVVSGTPSETEWFGWGVEDFAVAKKVWQKRSVKDREPPDRSATQVDEREFDARLVSDVEHTAAIRRIGDESRLLVDGKVVPPALYKPLSFGLRMPFTGEGKMFAESGIGLQTINVRLGGDDKRGGFWSRDGFDVAGALKYVKDAMRAAPDALYFVTIRLDAYPEYADEHPDEQWLFPDGSPVYGVYSAGEKKPSATPPKGMWKWVSNHSLVWRADVKRHLTTFIGALKAAGLSKRIVGIHLAGYHDGQFATMAPDYSKPAIAAFRRWQETRYGRVRWPDPPAYDAKRMLLDPSADEAQIAFQLFLKWGPFTMQEDVARHIRAQFGKSIVIGRWCMMPFGGSLMSALDFTPFVNSDAIDFLVAQPVYPRRVPGVACGLRVPLASFRAHGKIFLNEFDLRTWHGRIGSTEPRSYWLSEMLDRPMWESTHRKLSGQMLANSMGWWYFDMVDNWFGTPEIQADIASVQKFHRAHLARPSVSWRPSTAVLLDEEGCLLRNRIGGYFQPDEARRCREEEHRMTAEQLQILASAGVPYDVWLLDDWLKDPSRADGYRYVLTMGVYAKDAARQKLLEHLAARGATVEASDGRLTPAEFNRRVRAAGGYVPVRSGLQVDMSGDFLSVHCIIPGHYEFQLPRTCAVRNLKTGGLEPVRDGVLPLDLVGGETCWFDFL